MIIAALSLVAFVVGMFSPSTVKCSSRSKVALIFASTFIVGCILGASFAKETEPKLETPKAKTPKQDIIKTDSLQKGTPNEKKVSTSNEVKVLAVGDVITIPYYNSNVQIAFKDIKINRIPNNGLNLIFTLRIKNNSNEQFFISNLGFKLLDSEKIEVAESGIYDGTLGDFMPSTFFFTIIEPNIGIEEQVGYSIKVEDYFLSINGHIMARIPVKSQK